MDIDNAGDLIYYTYYMLDWNKVKQTQSGDRCITCGGPLNRLEIARDKKGKEYEGTVCHRCKMVLWVKH
jgi:uncharacterized protein with PIN domain